MNVYLVPVGADRYELYCEVPDETPLDGDDQPRGWLRRLRFKFKEMLAQAERDRRRGGPERPPEGVLARAHARIMRWVAESIAEQRLLWHLRRQTAACLFYPDDLDARTAADILRAQLGRDFERHRRWLVIDSLILLVAVALFWLPGPNILGYYFAFRVVGHYLSMRGARQGLGGIGWRQEASAPLTELRRLLVLDRASRGPRVHAVAATLRLEHLVSFFERSAVST